MGNKSALVSIVMVLVNVSPVYNDCPSGFKTDQKTRFGTKTGYEIVANLKSDRLEVPGCSPDFVWMFIRHGTRFPKAKRIRQMRERLPPLRDLIIQRSNEGKGSVCHEGIQALKSWKFNVMEEQGEHLAPIGDRELYSLATRWKARLGSLLNSPYHPREFRIRHTPTQRTEASARAFLRGLFGEDRAINVPSVEKGDPVLRGYKTCKNWRSQVKMNPKTYEEYNKFFEGPEVKQVIEAVRERSGIPDLEKDDMILMYDMLSYEEAWFEGSDNVSPWRTLFSPSDLVILQYLDDLELFYKDGHGNEISAQTSCMTVQDLLTSLRRSSDPEERNKAVFYFSHCGAITKLLARLGLFYSEVPPTANNFGNYSERVWDSSRVAPFGANLAILLYRCPRGQQPDRIQLFLHEKPLKIPACDTDTCTLDAFERYLTRPDPCDLKLLCGPTEVSRWPGASDVLLAIAFLLMGKWLIFTALAHFKKMKNSKTHSQ